jgi:predicted amidohydrolase
MREIMRVACVQMRAARSEAASLDEAEALIRQAHAKGAALIATPEGTNGLDRTPGSVLQRAEPEETSAAVARFGALAGELGVHLLAGSLALRAPDGRAANRSLLFGPDGQTLARYDKIHMFDVDLPGGETYRESASYRPGVQRVCVQAAQARLGLSICYDVRFPRLYRELAARDGAQVIAVPSAFTRTTGRAHWHVLLRARAIETGSFLIAPAQGGQHEDGRETYGHSLIVNPWGEVIAEIDGDAPGVLLADLDLEEVARARARIPAWSVERDWNGA